MRTALPIGQRELTSFPRFGLGRFARRFPKDITPTLRVGGAVERPVIRPDALAGLPRIGQQSDFHCVTTWSRRNLFWEGVRFADFHARMVAENVPSAEALLVVLHGQDGYRTIMQLDDLLGDDVLIADRLDGEPLSLAHGAPLRLVAPAHYGYKNVKHLCAIDYAVDRRGYRFPYPYPQLMDHPRARVNREERGLLIPSPVLRRLYRLIIPLTVRNFRRALEREVERRRDD